MDTKGGVLGGRMVAATVVLALAVALVTGCAPSGRECAQAHAAHVTVKGCR